MTKSLVFITGASGFIGAHVVAVTLKAEYRVRLSIRKPEQEAVIRKRYAEFNSDIEIVVVPDLANVDALKSALNGVDYVFHIASPMPGSGIDLQRDYITPAVQATLSMLNAALAHEQIQKVVIVSSVLALTPVDALIAKSVVAKENTGEVIPVDVNMTFPEGFGGHGLMYAASKIKAHQATRDYLKEINPHYKVLTLHPVFVLGDDMVQETADDIAGMNKFFYNSFLSEQPLIGNAWVHVRDVADAHVKALETDAESGKEFILSHPASSWADAAKLFREKYPTLGSKLQPPFDVNWGVENTAAEQILGLKWRSVEKIVSDVVDQQLSYQ
ncbi:dihydroflavonal-4-reductase [Penicillium longicatenatum]|nr:dihydroflavonal-4-reductase [Penicillium longicatenatum]